MLFNSITFIVFFTAVVLLFYALPQKFRWLLLLVASCIFYGAFIPEYLLILFAIILVDFYAAKMMSKVQGAKRKRYLWISVSATCALLLMFKYFNFASENIHGLAALIGWNYDPVLLKWVLPIGLSFHTFQSLSYVIEVYRGKQVAEKHLGIYATYVMFFPQLVAGPIERPQNLLPQFREKKTPNYDSISRGFRQALYGFFKKMVIADNLSLYVDAVYADPANYSGSMAIVATIFFGIQIYCDFSGYSDIAIGTARILGFKLMRNFNFPYFSVSIVDFWRRWHISLSTWFRDYVYVPMGGSRVGRWRWFYNLFIVFLLSGIWHGAGWTFIVWGLLHWFYFVLYAFIDVSKLSKLQRVLSGVITFLLVMFAWVFFRATDMHNALAVISSMLSNTGGLFTALQSISDQIIAAHPLRPTLLFLGLSMLIFIIAELSLAYADALNDLHKYPKALRLAGYYFMIVWILFFGVYETTPHFVYFQF